MNFWMNFLSHAPVAAENSSELELIFEPGNFVTNLSRMGIGMLVIFVIIGIIMLSTRLINWLCSEK